MYAPEVAEAVFMRNKWQNLLDWYDASGRDLPWRHYSDPYAVWISEVMLQQTQVSAVVPYFERWMGRFPDVEALASANEQDVLTLLQGLGYYRRCRMVLNGARWIRLNGMPATREGWLRVPGVGPYTASAISSIAFGEPAGVVDGNVERVFARLTGCRESGPELLSLAREWADHNVSRERPGDWNQAVMELGATLCTARLPQCAKCPLASRCVAKQSFTVGELPVRSPSAKTVHLHFTVWVPYCDGEFGLRQIADGQWSGGLWEFPKIEQNRSLEESEGESLELRSTVGAGWLESLGQITHSVTHHRIHLDLWLVRVNGKANWLRWASLAETPTIPMPSAQRKILAKAARALGMISRPKSAYEKVMRT